jgi:hypothetical protein
LACAKDATANAFFCAPSGLQMKEEIEPKTLISIDHVNVRTPTALP